MVHPRDEDQQKIVQQQRLVVQVELDGAVVELNVGHFGDNVLEMALTPRLSGVLDHRHDGVVILLILVIQEDQLVPQVRLFRCPKDLSTKMDTYQAKAGQGPRETHQAKVREKHTRPRPERNTPGQGPRETHQAKARVSSLQLTAS